MKPRKPQAQSAAGCAICHKAIKRGAPTAKAKTGKICHAACLSQAVRAGQAGANGSPTAPRASVPAQKVPKPQRRRAASGSAGRQGGTGEMSFAENKRAVESGETFRSQKPSDWRLGSSPSKAGRGLR